jgi:hypothetical protein
MPTPAIQANIQGAPIRVEMKAPQGPGGKSAYQIAVENGFEGTEAQWLASLVGPNTVTSATTTNFTSGNVLFANSGFVGSLSRSGIDTRTSFPNDDVTAATSSPTAGTIVRRDGDGAVSLASSLYEGVTLDVISSGNDYAQAIRGVATGNLGVGGDFKSFSGTAVIAESINGTYHATFGVSGDNRSAVERVRGWFVWFYSTFTGRLKTANITANRDWTLPNASGTIALTSDIVNSVTSATTSDGTANLSISNVTTATATVSSLLTANHIHGNIAGTLYTHVRTGEAVNKGDPVYVSGFHNGTGQAIVMKADASDAGKMPAIGVMDAAYAQNVSGANCVIAGTITSVDTDDFSINSPVYVGNGGGFSETIGTIPQQVGIVERSNQNNGAFVVTNNKVISSADITDATSENTANTVVKRSSTGYTEASVFAAIYPSNAQSGFLSVGNKDGAITYETIIKADVNTDGILRIPNLNSDEKTAVITGNADGSADSLTDGTIAGTTTFNSTSYTYGTGAAAAHRTALGLTTLSTTTPAANVANFLATPTSDNLASALTDESGTGGGFVRAEGATLTTPTFTGSAARANGQNAVPATDDEIIVRQRSAKESFYSIGTVRNIVYPPSFGTSGTGSATAVTDAGNRLFSLNSGTANSGWARATLARGVSTAPNVTGTGINYNKKLGISIAFTTGKSNFTNTGNVTRIVFGTNQTATADGVDPLSALGFGIEFRANGSSHDIRVFGHNGTSISYSSWVNSGCPSSVASAVHTLGLESDGAGNLFGFFAVNSSRTLVTVTGTGGPTGTGTSANSYVDVQSCNSASSTTSQIVVGFDAKIYVE